MSAIIITIIPTIGLEQNHHSTCSIVADYSLHGVRECIPVIREEMTTEMKLK